MRWTIPDYLLRVKDAACFYLARELGFDGIEWTAERIDEDQFLFRPEAAAELGLLHEATGVVARSVFAAQFLAENLVHPDADERSAFVRSLVKLWRRASVLGIATVVVPIFGLRGTEPGEMERLQELLERLSEAAVEPGPRLALKTLLPAEKLREVPDRAGPISVGVCFDPGMLAGLRREPLAEAAQLAPRILHVQLTDRNRYGAAVPLGEGRAETARFLCALARLGYTGDVVLHGPAGASAVESARRSLRVCRQWLAAAA